MSYAWLRGLNETLRVFGAAQNDGCSALCRHESNDLLSQVLGHSSNLEDVELLWVEQVC